MGRTTEKTIFEAKLDRQAMTPWQLAQPIFVLCSKLEPKDAKVAIAAVALVVRLLEAAEDVLLDTEDTVTLLDKIEGKT